MKFHPEASMFPLLKGKDFNDLCASINKYGLQEPIWIYENQILDGRNRSLACQRLKIKPKYREWEPDKDVTTPEDFVIWINLDRRHLTDGQRAMAAAMYAESHSKKKAGPGRGKKKKEKQSVPRGQTVSKKTVATPAQTEAAEKFKTTPTAVRKAGEVLRKDKKKAKEVLDGEKSPAKAAREIQLEENKKLAANAPPPPKTADGNKFQCIVIDPPWDHSEVGDSGMGEDFRGMPSYSRMGIEDIAKLPIKELADTNCHLYLWTTNRMLQLSFDLLDGWGFRYITLLTWCKPQIGLGNYYRNNTEHILFGVKGRLPLLMNNVGTWFEAKRMAHSEKPQEFYKMVEQCSPGPRVDMFARKERDNWTTWGAEV